MVSRVTFSLIFLCAASASAAVWYVDRDNRSGTEDGLSWATAFTTIQPAIDAASGEDELWIAEGVYDEVRTTIRLTGSDDKSVNTGSLLIPRGLAVYGGFAGTETARDQRDWTEHETVIDGFQSRDGSRAYHVILVETSGPVVLDGLTIRGGKADRSFRMLDGGGVRVAQKSDVTIANCTISQNEATGYGGGLCRDRAS